MTEPANVARVIPLDSARRPARCRAVAASGRPCRNPAGSEGFCAVHRPPPAPERVGPFEVRDVQAALDFVGRRITGRYDIDAFGFDRDLVEHVLAPLARPVHRRWFRATWKGLEHVPSSGPALLVGNHAGSIPIDALVVRFGLFDEHPAHRHLRLLAADLAFRWPYVGPLARKLGATLAGEEDAHRLLSAGELVGVFPEGYKGVGKGYRNRYRLRRFGRGGFVATALRARVPIVPVSIVGSEETYPMLWDARPLARLFGLPYFPVTPTFPLLGPVGLVPLPSRWIVEFGPPIPTEGYAADAWQDGMLLFELSDRIRDTIQQTLYRNLIERHTPFA